MVLMKWAICLVSWRLRNLEVVDSPIDQQCLFIYGCPLDASMLTEVETEGWKDNLLLEIYADIPPYSHHVPRTLPGQSPNTAVQVLS
jgi:hypothetical protein